MTGVTQIREAVRRVTAFAAAAAILLACTACSADAVRPHGPHPSINEAQAAASSSAQASESAAAEESAVFSLSMVPEYGKKPYAVINGNVPYFTEDEITDVSFERYSELDSLGRCGAAFASVGSDLMPEEERGEIGAVRPSGWQTVKYDIVDGKYLYNRCHLIGYQLTGENANPKNLITGTRYLNINGMLDFENMTGDYIRWSGNHVMYRVTPYYSGDELVARGVLMEARSVEDNGKGICFCVWCYNVQPGVSIDYATGKSTLAG